MMWSFLVPAPVRDARTSSMLPVRLVPWQSTGRIAALLDLQAEIERAVNDDTP
jgi:hypothetical protein